MIRSYLQKQFLQISCLREIDPKFDSSQRKELQLEINKIRREKKVYSEKIMELNQNLSTDETKIETLKYNLVKVEALTSADLLLPIESQLKYQRENLESINSFILKRKIELENLEKKIENLTLDLKQTKKQKNESEREYVELKQEYEKQLEDKANFEEKLKEMNQIVKAGKLESPKAIYSRELERAKIQREATISSVNFEFSKLQEQYNKLSNTINANKDHFEQTSQEKYQILNQQQVCLQKDCLSFNKEKTEIQKTFSDQSIFLDAKLLILAQETAALKEEDEHLKCTVSSLIKVDQIKIISLPSLVLFFIGVLIISFLLR